MIRRQRARCDTPPIQLLMKAFCKGEKYNDVLSNVTCFAVQFCAHCTCFYSSRRPVDDGGVVALLAVIVVAPGPHFPFVGDGETMQRSDGHVDDLLAHQAFYQLRQSDVRVGAVSQSEIVALAPRPHLARVTRQGQRELGAAFDLADAQPVQGLDVLRGLTALATTTTCR